MSGGSTVWSSTLTRMRSSTRMTASPKADACFSDGRVRLLLALVAAVLTIAGCGGGGGHSATPSPRPTSPPTVRFDRLTGPTYDIPLPQGVGGPAAVNDPMRP